MSRIARFHVGCVATYDSSLRIPDEIPKGKELDYILEHLDECQVESDIDWLNDLEDEPVIEDDIFDIEEEEDE